MDLHPLLATFTYKHTRWLVQMVCSSVLSARSVSQQVARAVALALRC